MMLEFLCAVIVIAVLVLARLAWEAIRRKRKPPHQDLVEQLHGQRVTVMVGDRKIECHGCTFTMVQPPRMMESGLIVTTYVFEAHHVEAIEGMK